MPHRVAFLGFSEFERQALASYFRLTHNRSPAYQQVATLTDADFLVADADHGPSVALVQAIERMDETVFIGNPGPEGARACMKRPIDALQVMRELDRLVACALKAGALHDDPAEPPTPTVQPARQRPGAPVAPSHPTDNAMLGDLPFSADAPAAARAFERVATPADVNPLIQRDAPPIRVTRATTPTSATIARPAPAAAAGVPAATPTKDPVLRVPPVPARPRVLLVDDSAIALRFLEVRLAGWQLSVDRATTSQAAAALLAKHSYDIVFLDIELGAESELDGLTLCQRIKHSPALLGASVILVSAHHSELDRVRGALAGCDAYLAKPLDMRELQRLMDRQGVAAVCSERAVAP